MFRRLAPCLLITLACVGCSGQAAAPAPTVQASQADLSGIKTYLVSKSTELGAATATLKAHADQYYALAKAANFDYAALWQNEQAATAKLVVDARTAWVTASPLYEQMEGIVAGTPSLAQYDVDIDAGASAAEDQEGAVSFDLTLPDGRTLAKPGNLFGITESTLWGTFPAFSSGVSADVDGNSAADYSDLLPDANVLKGSVDLLAKMSTDLAGDVAAWTPTESDAFTALVVMVPTMSEYFDSWKNSRFISGETSEQRDFVAISRLADIQNILGSLQVVHEGVSPLIKEVDPAQDQQIGQGLSDLKIFIADVYQQEQGGARFSAEEADTLGVEAQNRATAITGQISQVAAQLNIPIAE